MTSTARLAAAVLAGFLFASASPARAGDDLDDGPTFGAEEHDQRAGYVLRDERGRRTGTLEEETPGYFVQRDNRGTRIGTIQCNGITFQCETYDTRGRRTGSVERQ